MAQLLPACTYMIRFTNESGIAASPDPACQYWWLPHLQPHLRVPLLACAPHPARELAAGLVMMPLADAGRLCNREIVDNCQQLIIMLFHDSLTQKSAIEYAEEKHKIVTAFYLD